MWVMYIYQLHSRQFIHHILINLSYTTGCISWINREQTNVSWTNSLMMRMQTVLKMSAFFPILPPHMAGSPTQFYCTQSPMLQIIQILFYYKNVNSFSWLNLHFTLLNFKDNYKIHSFCNSKSYEVKFALQQVMKGQMANRDIVPVFL